MAMTSSKCTDDMTFKAVTSDNKCYYKAFKQCHCNKILCLRLFVVEADVRRQNMDGPNE